MTQKGESRNADFILIARKGATTTLGAEGPVKLTNLWAAGPSILRTLFMQPFYTTCGVSRTPLCPLGASSEPGPRSGPWA